MSGLMRQLWHDLKRPGTWPDYGRGQGFVIGLVVIVPLAIFMSGSGFKWVFLAVLALVAGLEVLRRALVRRFPKADEPRRGKGRRAT